MKRPALAAAALLLIAANEPPEFEAAAERFGSAGACRERLTVLAQNARTASFEAVEGPYAIAQGDVRIHTVRMEGAGHRIAEHRCLAEALSSRSWTHSHGKAEAAETIESLAGKAEWLKKAPPQR